MIFSTAVTAQDEPYTFTFAPDLWYNDVDGIRTGIRVLGEVEGTFKDGPHRLDAGIWLGTWLPENPISYYVSLTEPIPELSDFGNEFSFQIISSIRTGYSQHKLQLNKRWQKGFDEYDYTEVAFYFSQEKLLDAEYRPFPQLWNSVTKSILGLDFRLNRNMDTGQFLGMINLKQNVNSESGSFSVGTIELLQRIDLSKAFTLRVRGFAGLTSENSSLEYRFLSSMNPAQNWLNKGVSRAKGTISTPWLEAGSFQIGGGANLRGYLNRDIDLLKTVEGSGLEIVFPLYQSIFSVNTEFEFPNPINKRLKSISLVGDLIELRSYFFLDAGKGSNFTIIHDPDANIFPTIPPVRFSNFSYTEKIIADAGTGLQLSINIPDYLGKDRGIFIRYDIPFWLSDPGSSESNFAFRQLIGLGAIISF